MKKGLLAAMALVGAIGFMADAEAQTRVWIKIQNSAAYDIRFRKKTSVDDWTSWTGRFNAGDSQDWWVPTDRTYATVEIQYNNGSSWKHLCTETISPLTSATLKSTGTLFNTGCKLEKH